jgi:glutamate synthase (NADPH) small chain
MSEEKKTPKKAKKPKIPRQPMPEQPPEVRRHNFEEVPYGYPEETALIEASRCIQCKKPKCVLGCPVSIDIPAFILKIVEKDFVGAIAKIKEANMLPAICGRVCPQETQCEELCILGKKGEPVAIGRLERFLADWEREQGQVPLPECALPSGKKVAVVGSGPAGLSVAADLIKLGHQVVVFEALHKLGGVLAYGIPEFRMPKAIIKAETDVLERCGVVFQTNTIIGRTDTIDELLGEEGFDAVFLGTGAGLPWFMNIPGENLNGVYSANEFLTRSNLMLAYRFPEYDTPIRCGKNVSVVGGGNVAMDSVRTALRLGAENVYLIYRRSMEEMPARNEEIHHAKEEGVDFRLLTNPIRYIGDDAGNVIGVECLQMELGEPDASGRRSPIAIEGSEFVIDIDTAVVSIGNGANPLIPQTTPDLEVNKRGCAVVDWDTCRTSKKGVFAGGDFPRGGATVILAMGDGRTAAASINDWLQTGVWEVEKKVEEEKPKE